MVVAFLIACNYFYSNNRVYIYIVLIVYSRTLITVPTNYILRAILRNI